MTHGIAVQCNNNSTHIVLFYFRKIYEKWRKNGGNNRSDALGTLLNYFRRMEANKGNVSPIDVSCPRILLLIQKELSFTNDEFRVVHDNYWDAWGQVIGRLLRKRETEPKVDVSVIFEDLRNNFSKNDWYDRQRIVKGFKGSVEQSRGYHKDILNMLVVYFFAYCRAATSGIVGALPTPICNTIDKVIRSQYSVAVKYAKDEFDIKYHDIFLEKLLESALSSLKFIIRAADSPGFKPTAAWVPWRKIIIECLFPASLSSAGENIEVSIKVKEAFENFIAGVRQICLQNKAQEMHFLLDGFLEDCEKISTNLVIPKWWKRLVFWR